MENYLNGMVDLELLRDEDKSAWVGATASRGGEVKLFQLSAKQRTEFIHSDSVEWGTIVKTGAVKICSAGAFQVGTASPRGSHYVQSNGTEVQATGGDFCRSNRKVSVVRARLRIS